MLIFTNRATYLSQTLRLWQGVDDGRGGHLADVKSPILLLGTIISGRTYISDCASTLHPSILSLKKKNWLYFFRELTLWPILKRSGHCLDHHLIVGVSILLLLMRPGENGWGRLWLWWWWCWWWLQKRLQRCRWRGWWWWCWEDGREGKNGGRRLLDPGASDQRTTPPLPAYTPA